MYLLGSFITALAILASTAINNKSEVADKGTKEDIAKENKNLKVFVLFLLMFSVILVFTKFKHK